MWQVLYTTYKKRKQKESKKARTEDLLDHVKKRLIRPIKGIANQMPISLNGVNTTLQIHQEVIQQGHTFVEWMLT